ncbi:serine hydrolase [Kocuria sediminis]|uniref:Serine hydrolase n=2 Tax=Kocuria sediminis TaxID=1038857 RepID=A0A6N8GP05_9MICC|nr:serine hydrolase [Kocuria sediminis]
MMATGRIPGLSLVVVDAQRSLYAGGFGTADLSTGAPATPSTAFLWFSMSKIVTATAVMTLVEDGRLELDAPAADYVDYLRAPAAAQPTVRQLLTHTAGWSNPLPLRWVHPAGQEPPAVEDLLRSVLSRPRAYRHTPGRKARYTNIGYLALGQVIEAVSGMPVTTYLQHAVLDPAGMTGTGFTYRPGVPAATGYVRASRAADPLLRRLLPPGVAGTRHGAYLGLRPFYVDGPAYGGLVGDVVDAGRFLRLHLGDGQVEGRRILSAETAWSMRVIEHPGKPFDHGIGWFRRPTKGAGQWIEHFGAGAGFWNIMRLYPDQGLGIAVMTNSTTTYDFEPLFALLTTASWS